MNFFSYDRHDRYDRYNDMETRLKRLPHSLLHEGMSFPTASLESRSFVEMEVSQLRIRCSPGHKLLGHLLVCALKPTISTTSLMF